MRPLILDIAEQIDMHESTVSRYHAKICATPQGLYELKYFFSSQLASDGDKEAANRYPSGDQAPIAAEPHTNP